MARKRVLFLCTGNSCRSQMAEGWLNHLGGETHEAVSAGTSPTGEVHPLAVEVMAEAGVDISGQESKGVANFLTIAGKPDVVVTVCEAAADNCPVFPGDGEKVHIPFDDPAEATGGDAEVRATFARVRDEIKTTIEHALKAGSFDIVRPGEA